MYTIRRMGKFETRLIEGYSHCSVPTAENPYPKSCKCEGAPRTLEYDAWVTVGEDGLDEQGFVVDNRVFSDFFSGQKEMRISCEQLAKKAAVFLFETVAQTPKRRAAVLEVCVKVWGLPDEAYAEYMWVKAIHKKYPKA